MNVCQLSHDRSRTLVAVMIIQKLHAAIACLEQCSEDRSKRRMDRKARRRRLRTLRQLEELPWEVRKEVGSNRDF